MTAAEIAARLGAAHRSGRWWRCLCPVHGSRTGRSATLALRDGERGLIAVCHAGCDHVDIIATLRELGLIGRGSDARHVSPVTSGGDDFDDSARRIALAQCIWDAARDARETPVTAYLADRSITISPPPALRWAPDLRRGDGTSGPAMVARIDDLAGDLIGVHRTWLDRGLDGIWRRRDRAMLGRAAGGAVRLAPAAESLMIAEGIETAMAAMTATAQPAWAAPSTSGLRTLVLPPIVRRVTILADHDPSGAGERAAWGAAERWLAEGRRVRIAMPPEPGTDFNDVLLGRRYARIMEAGNVAA